MVGLFSDIPSSGISFSSRFGSTLRIATSILSVSPISSSILPSSVPSFPAVLPFISS